MALKEIVADSGRPAAPGGAFLCSQEPDPQLRTSASEGYQSLNEAPVSVKSPDGEVNSREQP